MKGIPIPTRSSNDCVQQESTHQGILHEAKTTDTRVLAREPSLCFEDAFQPYDPKKHHTDARYISSAFQEYYSGKKQIALEVPLNLASVTDHDVKSRDLYHPTVGRNVLSPRGFRLNCSPPKRPELPLMPPDKLLAHASERHLNSVALNPFLTKQLFPHQSVAQFISLSDGTLCTYPLTHQQVRSKHRRSYTPFRPTPPAHASARNLTSPLGSFAEPTILGSSPQSNFACKKRVCISNANLPTYSRKMQEIHMKLFPVVDNRGIPGRKYRSESVPAITPMVTNENFFAQPLQSPFKNLSPYISSLKHSPPPAQKRPASTYIVDSFPGRLVGEKRPLTTTISTSKANNSRQHSPSFKSQDSPLTRELTAKEATQLGGRPQRSAPTIARRPTMRSSLGAWALDQSPAEEILEKVNREHALPPRRINFSCKKTIPLYRARSTG